MKSFNFPQYSREWWETRRGVPTASEFSRIMTAKKLDYAAGARTYAIELVADLYDAHYGQRDGDRRATGAMLSGTLFEPESRRCYEFAKDCKVEPVGFMLGGGDDRFGASPDGLVGDEGILECKNCEPAKHLAWLLAGVVPDEHKAQVHGQLIVSGRKWCDFMSYCPGFPPLIVRTEPDAYTETLRSHLETFWYDLQAIKDEVLGLAGQPLCVTAKLPDNFASQWAAGGEVIDVADVPASPFDIAVSEAEAAGVDIADLLGRESLLWEDIENDLTKRAAFLTVLNAETKRRAA